MSKPALRLDVFAVALQAGQTIQAEVLAHGFRAGNQPGSSLSAVLSILDRDGSTVLAQEQSLGDFDDPTAGGRTPCRSRWTPRPAAA